MVAYKTEYYSKKIQHVDTVFVSMLETASSTGPVNQEASKERKLSSFCLFKILDPDFFGTIENKTVLSMYLAEEIGSDMYKRGTLNPPNVQA